VGFITDTNAAPPERADKQNWGALELNRLVSVVTNLFARAPTGQDPHLKTNRVQSRRAIFT
jgi:hypothetical protein